MISGPMRGLEKNCTRWHRHTHRHTHGHGDSMSNSAQRGRVGENATCNIAILVLCQNSRHRSTDKTRINPSKLLHWPVGQVRMNHWPVAWKLKVLGSALVQPGAAKVWVCVWVWGELWIGINPCRDCSRDHILSSLENPFQQSVGEEGVELTYKEGIAHSHPIQPEYES